MKEPKVWGAWVDGFFMKVKAYQKDNALKSFQKMDSKIKESDLQIQKIHNPNQNPIDTP